MKLSRIKKLIFLHLQHLPMKSRGWRPTLCKWGGVNIKCPKKTFIGEDVIFDTNYPEDIVIEEGVRLTVGVRIVTHFMNRRQAVMTAVKCMLAKEPTLAWEQWLSSRSLSEKGQS